MDNIIFQFMVAGTTGALAVAYVFGLRYTAQIFKAHREGASWHASIKEVLGRKVGAWLCFIFALLMNLMIVSGILLPIFFA